MFAAAFAGLVFGSGGTLALWEYKDRQQRAQSGGFAVAGGAAVPGAVKPNAGAVGAVPAGTKPTKGSSPPPPVSGSEAPSLEQELAAFSTFGLPTGDFVVKTEGYVSSFDAQRRVPRWVLEVITPESLDRKDASRDGHKFVPSPLVPALFRAENSDYSVHGLSRGHLAPAQYHKGSQAEMASTFDLSLNIVPQDMTSNACDWFRVEQVCKLLIRKHKYQRLEVLTGPLYMPAPRPAEAGRPSRTTVEYDVVGRHEVAVPTHLFKAIAAVDDKGAAGFTAFVVPNAPVSDERPLTAFQVPKEQLERLTGLRLFPALDNARPYDICRKHDCSKAAAGSFSGVFRDVGRLRLARTRGELEETWGGLQRKAQLNGKDVEAPLRKEYDFKRGVLEA